MAALPAGFTAGVLVARGLDVGAPAMDAARLLRAASRLLAGATVAVALLNAYVIVASESLVGDWDETSWIRIAAGFTDGLWQVGVLLSCSLLLGLLAARAPRSRDAER